MMIQTRIATKSTLRAMTGIRHHAGMYNKMNLLSTTATAPTAAEASNSSSNSCNMTWIHAAKLLVGGGSLAGMSLYGGHWLRLPCCGDDDVATEKQFREEPRDESSPATQPANVDASSLQEQQEQPPAAPEVHPLRETFSRMSTFAPYLAYSSDIGEAFRRVSSLCLVNSSYALSGMYITSDIAYNGWREYQYVPPAAAVVSSFVEPLNDRSTRVGLTVAHATLYQGLASLLIPYLVIHNAVHFAEHYVFGPYPAYWSAAVRNWGPSAVALTIIPFLPLVDETVEEVVDWVFEHTLPHRRDRRRMEEELLQQQVQG